MKLEELKNHLSEMEEIRFILPQGELVAPHFHVTEVGKITKHFIDCGGIERQEEVVNFQLWEADDFNHRLHPEKLLNIIELSQNKLNIGNLDIEVEYQGDTIGKYHLKRIGNDFHLTSTKTDCLAKDKCGVPQEKPKLKMADLTNNTCTPGGGCC